MMNKANDIIRIALEEVGYREKASAASGHPSGRGSSRYG